MLKCQVLRSGVHRQEAEAEEEENHADYRHGHQHLVIEAEEGEVEGYLRPEVAVDQVERLLLVNHLQVSPIPRQKLNNANNDLIIKYIFCVH